MASKQVVSTVFKAKDNISKAFKNMGKNSKRFGNNAERSFKKASKSANRFRDVTKSILAASAIQKTMSGITRGVQEVTTTFVQFDDALFSAASKFKDVNLTTKEGKQQMKALEMTARNVGSATQFNAKQAAEGLDFLALAGFDAKQSMQALPKLADLATAAGVSDLGKAVDIASDSLGAFGLASEDATQNAKNLQRVSDSLAKTQATTNTTIETLFETIKKGAPSFTSSGQSMETFNALAGVLASNSLKGSKAGTALKNVVLRLSDPSKQAASVLKDLNIQVEDQEGNFKNVIDILGQFQKATKDMGNVQRSAALSTVFGKEAINGVNILLDEGVQKLKGWEDQQKKAGGTTKEISKVMRQSLGNRIKALQSALTEIGFKFLSAFRKQGVGSIEDITKAVRKFEVKPIVEGVKSSVDLFKDLIQVASSTIKIFSPLIAAWGAYKIAVLVSTAVTKGFGIATAIVEAYRKGAILATAAQWAWNTAMMANPIGLIVAGVTLLGVGLFMLIKRWGTVKKAFIQGGQAILRIFKRVWEFVKDAASMAGGFIGDVLGLTGGGGEGGGRRETFPEGFSPPNRREAQAGAGRFEGIMRFENMPGNATFEQNNDSPLVIQPDELGAN